MVNTRRTDFDGIQEVKNMLLAFVPKPTEEGERGWRTTPWRGRAKPRKEKEADQLHRQQDKDEFKTKTSSRQRQVQGKDELKSLLYDLKMDKSALELHRQHGKYVNLGGMSDRTGVDQLLGNKWWNHFSSWTPLSSETRLLLYSNLC